MTPVTAAAKTRTQRRSQTSARAGATARPGPVARVQPAGRSKAATRSRSAARSRPTERSRPASRAREQRRGITPATGLAIPAAAVGKTAVAVGDLADSGVMVRLTRSRLWIGLLGALLAGIVALNVVTLSMNAGGSQSARKAEALERENSALRARLAKRLSNEKVQGTAAHLGMVVPEPGSIGYVEPTTTSAEIAARRIRSGKLTSAAAVAGPPAGPVVEPATGEPGTIAPAAAAPAAVEPAEPSSGAPAAAIDPTTATAPAAP